MDSPIIRLDESTLMFSGDRSDFFLISFFDAISLCKQNNPEQNAASHLGLCCLPMLHKKDAGLI